MATYRIKVRLLSCASALSSFFLIPTADAFFDKQKITWPAGSYCEYYGVLKYDRPHGQGEWECADGTKYEGGWAFGLMHGEGRLTGQGIVYTGAFYAGKMDGKGRLKRSEGVYTGTFEQSISKTLFSGKLVTTNGFVFEGNFQDFVMWKGKVKNPNGDRYEGEAANGAMHGNGTYTWKSGARYVGGWKNGKQHGQGTQYNPDGTIKYRGWFCNGKKSETPCSD